ncbi:MAG: hypothetical protein WD432_00730, partial [Candidatus Saccharimonadales bacterium]
ELTFDDPHTSHRQPPNLTATPIQMISQSPAVRSVSKRCKIWLLFGRATFRWTLQLLQNPDLYASAMHPPLYCPHFP